MNTITIGSPEYKALLHEWCYWDRLAQDGALSEFGETRLREIDARLNDAEMGAMRVPSVFEVVASDYDEAMLRWAGAGCEVFEP